MIHPLIHDYRDERRKHFIAPLYDRRQFLGQSALDLRWDKYLPKVNIKKGEHLFEIEIVMPGFNKEEISITIQDDVLTVKGEKREVHHDESSEYIVKEFDNEIVERKFKLARNIGHEKVKATYVNGLLKLTFIDVPKSEEKESQTVIIE